MKANELMIGDWVLKDNKPRRITRILDYGRISVNNPYGQYEADCGCEDVTPIPLTEEILKANGIPTNGDTFWFDNDKDYVLELCFISGRLYWTINLNEYRLMDFKYVHQLQHALRLCGLNELADNFKIK